MRVLLLLCVAQFVVVLDVTIVAVALPAIDDDLGFGWAGLQWVVTAYALAFGGLLVSAGRAADLFGRRRLFVAGLALFAAASAGCGLARAPETLVAMRALQGAGAALLAPAALALVTDAYPDGPRRRRALGVWTAAAAGGGAAGWVLGGVLTETLGWPAIFLLNVPVGIAGVALAPRVLPAGEPARTGGALARLDVPGAVLITAALVALVLGLSQARLAVPALAVAALLFVAFRAVERRVAVPLVPPGTFGDRDFARAVLVALALTAATTSAMLLSVLRQQEDLGRSATETGLACLPFNAAVIAGSLLAGRLRTPPRATMAAGLVTVAAGALALFMATVAGYVLMGAGLGAASVASTAAGTAALGERAGLASGLLNAAAQIGPPLGLALLLGLGTTGFAGAAAIALAAALAQLGATRPHGARQRAEPWRPRRAA